MNREIKFRAYSNQADKIMDWDFIKSVGNLTKLICLNHVDVMEYIGLKDKNGTEIYEGDIINIDVSGEYLTYGMIRSEVKFYTNQAQFGFTTPNGWLSFCHKHYITIEVIGNIYENANLLTTQAGGV